MATTRIMPLHTGKGRTVGQAIADIIGYVDNPDKTDNGRLVTSWKCNSRIADTEFLYTKNEYIQRTGRVRGEDDVIAYRFLRTPNYMGNTYINERHINKKVTFIFLLSH